MLKNTPVLLYPTHRRIHWHIHIQYTDRSEELTAFNFKVAGTDGWQTLPVPILLSTWHHDRK